MSQDWKHSNQLFQTPFYQTASKQHPHSAGDKTWLKHLILLEQMLLIHWQMPASPWSRCSLCIVIKKRIKQQQHCKKVNNKFCRTRIDPTKQIGVSHFFLWGLLDLYHERIMNAALLIGNTWMLQKQTYNQWQCRLMSLAGTLSANDKTHLSFLEA